MILPDDLIPFLLHLESYLVYEKGHKVGHQKLSSSSFATSPFVGVNGC